SYLILTQSDGLEHMKLRVFGLPIDNPDAAPLHKTARTRGWSWFQPYHDGEKVAFATDAGMFGLYGINQVHNTDQPLFPELAEQKQKTRMTDARPTRAQVVHAAENDFWVLADGVLQRLYFDL